MVIFYFIFILNIFRTTDDISFNKVLQIDSYYKALNNKGIALNNLGKFENAIEL